MLLLLLLLLLLWLLLLRGCKAVTGLIDKQQAALRGRTLARSAWKVLGAAAAAAAANLLVVLCNAVFVEGLSNRVWLQGRWPGMAVAVQAWTHGCCWLLLVAAGCCWFLCFGCMGAFFGLLSISQKERERTGGCVCGKKLNGELEEAGRRKKKRRRKEKAGGGRK